ncbi:MAG: ABC transporter permease [Chitinophagaceae bacterium]
MAETYSQFRAMMAIAKASLKAIFRSPSAVVFSLAFPLIFILVFGFVGGGGISIKVGIDPGSDINNPLFKELSSVKSVQQIKQESNFQMLKDLKKGRITAILNIQPITSQSPKKYQIDVITSHASEDKIQVFESILEEVISRTDRKVYLNNQTSAVIKTQVIPGREYKQIDFILPGMLGFSLLSAGIFGTAFVFFNLRQTLVLKRFFATPIKRSYIVMGEGLARLVFQLMSAVVIIGLGYFAFGFTLIHGWLTFFDLLLLSGFGLLIFMGFGFIVSSVAKNESTIPPIANIITLPQFLLAGTFFPIDVFPKWLQPICKAMPLTYLNDAFRKIAFEGLSLWGVSSQILILTVWGIIVYAVAIKVFRWE